MIQEKRIPKKYAAIACGEKCYRVMYSYSYEWKPEHQIMVFNNFEEADLIAKECAQGKHNCYEGLYINMR